MKEINGSNGLYFISSNGNVLSMLSGRWKKSKYLKGSINNVGYRVVNVVLNGVTGPKLLHRLIADAFIPNPENKPFVNHIDGNKLNNSIDNLEWVTCSENFRHAFNTGLYKGSMLGKLGKDNPLSKSVVQKTLDGVVIKIWDSAADVKRELGWHQPAITEVCNGKRNHYRKFKWQYLD